jgi:dihydropyrimidinase
MSDHDLVIRGGRVVTAGAVVDADVAVRGERISAIGRGLHGRRQIDADGLLVIPGAVDGHVHMRTERPLHVYDDTFETGTIAAAHGGVTAIVDQAQVEPGTPLMDGLRRRRAEGDGHSLVDYGLHLNLREPSLERVAEIAAVMDEGCPTVKLFMSYPDYQLPDDILLRAMQQVAGRSGMAVVHAENGAVVAELSRELAESGDIAGFAGISPPAMEGEAAGRALALAGLAGCRLLIFHVTTADALAALRRARDGGQPAFGEALLHHLLIGDEVYADPERAPQFRGTPPLRDRSHREALWQALADGTLDVVSTDHGPRRDRSLPGTSGIEVRLPLMYDRGVRDGRIDLTRWVELCCTGPARLHGLAGKGRLAPGCDADIVLFDPSDERRLTASGLHSAIDHGTYEGERVRGWPAVTISRGAVLVERRRLLAEPGHGRFLRRRYL